MPYVYPVILSIIFWLLDTYHDSNLLQISFYDALLFDYPEASPWIRIAITVAILSALFFHKKEKIPSKKEGLEESQHTLSTLYKISDITLSPIPMQKQFNEAAKVLQEDIQTCKTVFIGVFEKDSILIQNTNESLGLIGIKKQYFPYKEEFEVNSLEGVLSLLYLEKREWMDTQIVLKGISYRAITHLFLEKRTKKPIGLLGFILDKHDSHNYTHLMEQLANQIAFNIDLDKRKNEVIQSQNLYAEQLSSYDKQLNISNISKVQEFIEHETKRSTRYHTQLTLILISIDHFENLSNIFSKEDIIALKKEFIHLFKKNIRGTDLFGKWMDEKFVIVAPDIDFRAGRNFVRKLNELLQKHRFAKVGKITCSYGITSYSTKDTMGEFRKRAENALGEAIKRGGDSVEIKILV